MSFTTSWWRVVLFVTAVASGLAQPSRKTGAGGLNADLVKTGLYVIYGGGCNTLLRLSGNGLIIVDSKLPGNYETLTRQIRRISEQPIRILVPTGPGEQHTGNDAEFAKAGTAILAHENLVSVSNGKAALPTKTYDRELPIRLGGIEVELMHFGNARTNADTVVYFPNLKVVAVGDLLSTALDPDFSAGGSLIGWSAVLGQVLKLDFDVVVPSTGSIATRADLEAFKTKLDTLISRARDLVRKGTSTDRLLSEVKTDDLSWRLNLTKAQVEGFYGELSKAR
ncbi:MAG TPA: hypothetical protein VKB79_04000 [Bryobacteraceae bacterium]|nr:hypothetical protein [Bryobacteraceae bacterium]